MMDRCGVLSMTGPGETFGTGFPTFPSEALARPFPSDSRQGKKVTHYNGHYHA
jgi:hypothetical protein